MGAKKRKKLRSKAARTGKAVGSSKGQAARARVKKPVGSKKVQGKKVQRKKVSPKVQPKKVTRKPVQRKTVQRKPVQRKTAQPKVTAKQVVGFGFGILPPAMLLAMQARAAGLKPAASSPRSQLKTDRDRSVKAKSLLTLATTLAPSRTALYQTLEITPATARDWQKNGVPKDQLPALKRLVDEYRAVGKQQSDNLKQQALLLKKALGFARNPVGLSRALIVAVVDVFSWMKTAGKKPLAPVVAQALARYVEIQEREEKKRAEQRKIFKQLMKLARKSKDEKGRPLVPKYRNADKPRIGPRTIGWTWCRVFQQELSAQLLDDIDVWIAGLPDKGFDHWQVIAHVTEFGGSNFIGYQRGGKPGPKQIGHEREGEFATDVELGGKVFQTKDGAWGQLLGYFEESDEEGLYIFVHAVAVNTFTRRTEEQRRAYETATRKERAKQKREKKTQSKRNKPVRGKGRKR